MTRMMVTAVSDSRLISDEPYTKGTEYGGVGNIIQPLPHGTETLPAHETRMLMMQVNREAGAITYADGSVDIETQRVPETKRVS
jgi:hypothetical protein